jgi:mRNA interferase RelE/StbE
VGSLKLSRTKRTRHEKRSGVGYLYRVGSRPTRIRTPRDQPSLLAQHWARRSELIRLQRTNAEFDNYRV